MSTAEAASRYTSLSSAPASSAAAAATAAAAPTCWDSVKSCAWSVGESLRAGSLRVCKAVPCGCACAIERLSPPRVTLGSVTLSAVVRDRVRSIRVRCTTAYDPSNEEHKAALYSFGVAVFGTSFTPQELRSPKWKGIGFQGTDPSTDFRGAGLFGLQNLQYLVHSDPRVVKRMTRFEAVSPEHYLPFALSGLNMTYMLLHALFLDCSWGVKLSPRELEVYLGFCALLERDEFAFEEIYKSALQLLDDRWVETRAKYFQFSEVLQYVREQVLTALTRRPATVLELNHILSALSTEADIP